MAWAGLFNRRRPETAPIREFPPFQKLAYAERLIENYYVDSVNGDKLAQEAIVAMLKTLDPHSQYSDPDDTKSLTTPLEGNFSGICVQFQMINDTLHVIQTVAGGPSEKVGILPGDKILQAGDSAISGVKSPNSRILKILRGPNGTEVPLKVKRRGEPRTLDFVVTRADIPIHSVDAAYMIDDTNGYIRVSRFAEDTPREFADALVRLRRKGMQNLVLDLQDNGGGYLGAAHRLASMFLAKGDTVVYTESPKMGTAYYTVETDPAMPQGRVVVLVNQYSASASEITAGALQDNDRAVVVGRRTFGKGLVQRPFPFPDGSMIRLTVSKYFTPSGRCIQKPYVKGEADDYRLDMKHRFDAGEFMSADSVRVDTTAIHHTLRNHRRVYGGGGILPDQFVPVDTTMFTPYYRDLVAKGIINRFAVTYVDNNRRQLRARFKTADDFARHFQVDSAMVRQIIDAGTADSVAYNKEQFERSRPMLTTIVKALVGRDLFNPGESLYFSIVNPALDPIYARGVAIIRDPALYDSLLQRPTQPLP